MATSRGKQPTALSRSGPPSPKVGERTLEDWLFQEPFSFDFFQAVRVLERLGKDRSPLGRAHAPAAETVRLLARPSLEFPPSAIYDLAPPADESRAAGHDRGVHGPDRAQRRIAAPLH